MKRFLATAVGALVLLSGIGLSACSDASWQYNDYIGVENDGFDKTLFYRNDGQVYGADPSVITVGDTYYLYATNADYDNNNGYIRGWKSKNLTDWEPLGVVFEPARDSWGVSNIWAPEVIEKDGTYYMYYSALNTAWQAAGSVVDEDNGTIAQYAIGVAVSSSPEGPFENIEGEYGGKTYTHTQAPIEIKFESGVALKTIDACPFIDDDGRVYLYFSRDGYRNSSSIWGVELESDMVTVKEGTLTQLISVSQDWERPADTSAKSWNEGPFMLKHDGKYYLTYSANAYTDFNYAVGVAVSNSPLSGFVKNENNPILEADPDIMYVSGTGHCSIFPSADGTQLYMAYHSHVDVEAGGGYRKIAFDRVEFDGDGNMVVCGPSVTPQLLPSGSSEWQNVAPLASISSTGAEGAQMLADGIVSAQYAQASRYEYAMSGDRTTVTFTLPAQYVLKAVMVYDSVDYAYSSEYVEVTIGDHTIRELPFDARYRYLDGDFGVKIPVSAAIAEFTDTLTDTVTVTFFGEVAASEIVIVGKEG